ncbi:MAG TPA: haloacid dehalogenase type II [candidate division Zixibacteria bacterium]|nr:haloacid dehalogenase type II [candidate division Zixibacteria bacterium]
MADPGEIKVLAFDVFGTVVDWRSSIIAEGERLGKSRGLSVDWAAFADAWRAAYHPSLKRVADGELPWTRLDDLHRSSLRALIERFGIEGLADDEVEHLNRVWHRLKPWPDAVPGLVRLKSRFIVTTLSNGNISLLTEMAKLAGLPWDCILSAEIVRRYKPHPEVYLMVPRLFDLAPGQVMLVAAHEHDLQGAQGQGLRTAFVHRPLEHGPDRPSSLPPPGRYDYVARDFLDLAGQLGV